MRASYIGIQEASTKVAIIRELAFQRTNPTILKRVARPCVFVRVPEFSARLDYVVAS
jgi:hypothetical protein